MNRYEDDLQKSIESGETPAGEEYDIKAYQQVFHALKRESEIKLSQDFSKRVVMKVIEKRKRDASRDMFWLGSGIFFLVIAFIIAIVMTGFKLEWGFLKSISGYAGVFIFGASFILLLNWLDNKLVSRQQQ